MSCCPPVQHNKFFCVCTGGDRGGYSGSFGGDAGGSRGGGYGGGADRWGEGGRRGGERGNSKRDDAEIEPVQSRDGRRSAGGMSVGSTGLTKDNVRTLTAGASQPLDDDAMSNGTRASSETTVSAFHGPHSNMRKEQRGIKFEDIKDAKVKGTVSLAIRFEGENGRVQAMDEIRRWGERIKEEPQFEGIAMGDANAKGRDSDLRMEVELQRSKERARDLKKWLASKEYFGPCSNRMIYAQRQEQGQELVVVEGRWGAEVRIITMFRRNEAGQETDKIDTAQAEIGKPLLRLISGLHPHEARAIDDGDDVGLLDELLKSIARRDDDGATLVGPGYKLSEWPIDIDGHLPNSQLPVDKRKSYPFLMWAAQLGRARIVEHLVREYGCSVHVEQTEGVGVGVTALHLAAYHGHADVVRILLKAGADPKKESNLYSDRYPIDSAKSGKETYKGNPSDLFPSMYVGVSDTNVPSDKFWHYGWRTKVDLSRGANWPQFDEIIEELQKAVSGN